MISSSSATEETGESVPEAVAADPAPRPVRRSFTAAYRLAVVAEYEAAPHGEKGAVLRREGLYHSHVKEWARARDAGALSGVAGARGSTQRAKGSVKDRGERVRAGLVAQGHHPCHERVWRLMQAAGLQGRHPKAWKRTTVHGEHPVSAPDLIKRDFTAPAPNIKWCGDIKCRRRHLMSYADLRTMPTRRGMSNASAVFGLRRSA